MRPQVQRLLGTLWRAPGALGSVGLQQELRGSAGEGRSRQGPSPSPQCPGQLGGQQGEWPCGEPSEWCKGGCEGEHGEAWTPGPDRRGEALGENRWARMEMCPAICLVESVPPPCPPGSCPAPPAQRQVGAGARPQPRPGPWAGGLPRLHGEPEVRRKPRPPGPLQLWEQMSYHSRQLSGRGDSWPNLAPVLAIVAGTQLQSPEHR